MGALMQLEPALSSGAMRMSALALLRRTLGASFIPFTQLRPRTQGWGAVDPVRDAPLCTATPAGVADRCQPRTGTPLLHPNGTGPDYDVVVVGAGISGLTTAQALVKHHWDATPRVLVTEAGPRVGGKIITKRREGAVQWEEGPNSFQLTTGVLRAIVDAGVVDDLVLADPKAPRFVYWGGQLRAAPSTALTALTSDLLSVAGKLRAALGFAGVKTPMPDKEETVQEFVTRNLGVEAFQRLIEPLCSGIYAGDAAKLSMKAAFGTVYGLERNGGSLLRGMLALVRSRRKEPEAPRASDLPVMPKGPTVGSFRLGLATLPLGMASQLGDRVATSWKLQAIDRRDGNYQLTYDTPSGKQVVSASSVALTVPAFTAADLLGQRFPKLAAALRSIQYPPMAAVALTYPTSALRPERLDAQGRLAGFGQLHPRSQGITTLGTLYTSSMFPGRIEDGRVLLLSYCGGVTHTQVIDMSEEDLIKQVDGELRKMLLRPEAEAPEKVAVRMLPHAIPQYDVGHLELLKTAQDDLAAAGWDGFFLGGNYVAGVALRSCMEYGYELARDLAAHAQALKPVA